jgi:hypothetical protein
VEAHSVNVLSDVSECPIILIFAVFEVQNFGLSILSGSTILFDVPHLPVVGEKHT